MPYIKAEDRPQFVDALNAVFSNIPANAGELNYFLSKTCDMYAKERGVNYKTLNEVIGVLECVKQEYYRRIIAPYEEKKIVENGDIY